MKIVDTIHRMTTLAKMLKKEGKTIGLVPTMGYLHEGHLSLARTAKKHNDIVVMSIFVNPKQFCPGEDLDAYPRDLKRDEALAASAGVDILFVPSAAEMYPEGYVTYVNVEGLTDGLCGASRPGHFKGVTTVVAKLFGVVQPALAYFGQKDAQQAIVIGKMAVDLNFDVEIKVVPTVREKDGLALSSRNVYLTAAERRDAAVLYKALQAAEASVHSGNRDAVVLKELIASMIREISGVRIEYISIVDAKDLKPVGAISGKVLIALAVFFGKTRLIDNIIVSA